MNPDKVLEELQLITRHLPPYDHEKPSRVYYDLLGRTCHKINQLVDWIGGGLPLPRTMAWGQRMGPAAGPVSQRLVMIDEAWQCAGCAAQIVNGVMTHKRDCREPDRPAMLAPEGEDTDHDVAGNPPQAGP